MPTSSAKLYHLYDEVLKSGKYVELVKILNATGNKLCADKLRKLPSYQENLSEINESESTDTGKANSSDFPVSRNGVTAIVTILAEYPSLNTVWFGNIARTLLSARSYGNLNNNSMFSVLLMSTLDAWRDDRANDATLRSLVDIIDKHNHAAATALLDSQKTIMKA